MTDDTFTYGPVNYIWPDGNWRLEPWPGDDSEPKAEVVVTAVDLLNKTITFGTSK